MSRRSSSARCAAIRSSSSWNSARPSDAERPDPGLLLDPLDQARLAGGDRLDPPVDPGLDAVAPVGLLRHGQIGHAMVPPGLMISSRTRTDGTRGRSDTRGRLERVDQLGRLLEREVLGAVDAELAEQPVEVGVLPAGDRADRPDLVLRGRLARPGSPGRRSVGVAVAAGVAVRGMSGRRAGGSCGSATGACRRASSSCTAWWAAT